MIHQGKNWIARQYLYKGEKAYDVSWAGSLRRLYLDEEHFQLFIKERKNELDNKNTSE